MESLNVADNATMLLLHALDEMQGEIEDELETKKGKIRARAVLNSMYKHLEAIDKGIQIINMKCN